MYVISVYKGIRFTTNYFISHYFDKKKPTQTNLIKVPLKFETKFCKKIIGIILGGLGLKICVKGTAKYKRQCDSGAFYGFWFRFMLRNSSLTLLLKENIPQCIYFFQIFIHNLKRYM